MTALITASTRLDDPRHFPGTRRGHAHGGARCHTVKSDARDERTKRVFDVVLATIALALASPLMVLVAVAIQIESPGPALFRQRRCGRHGRTFEICKFRSMHVQATEEFRQASRSDRRVTRVGRVIRRFSLDELPQLFNVLGGSMSLVGPRPHAPQMDTRFRHDVPMLGARYAVMPGITGWAQINGSRGETPHAEDMRRRVALDRYYIAHRSLTFDARILLYTVLYGWTDENVY